MHEWMTVLLIVVLFPFKGIDGLRVAVYSLFFLSYALDYVAWQRWKSFQWKRSSWVFVLMMLYFLLIPLHAPFETLHFHLAHDVAKYASFGAFAVMGVLGRAPYIRARRLALTTMLTAFVATWWMLLYHVGFLFFFQHTWAQIQGTVYMTRLQYYGVHMPYNLYMSLAAVIAAIWMVSHTGWKHRAGASLVFLTSVAMLCVSDSKLGPLIALVCLLSLAVLWLWKQNRVRYALLLSLAALTAAMAAAPSIYHKYEEHADVRVRVSLWRSAASLVAERPLWGYGESDGSRQLTLRCATCCPEVFLDDYYASFDATVATVRAVNLRGSNDFIHAHNIFVQTLVYSGLIGLLILISMLLGSVVLAPCGRRLQMLLLLLPIILQGMTDNWGIGVNPMFVCVLIWVVLTMDGETTAKQDLALI